MKRIGACVAVLGAMVAGALAGEGTARADDVVAQPEKVAYVDPNSATGDTTSGDGATEIPIKRPHRKEDDDDALDVFRIGAFGGVAFPRPLSLEGFMKIEKTIGFGLEYSVLPAMSLSGVDTTFWALAGDVRVFPFENGFFIGMTAGRQHVGASTTLAVPPGVTLPPSISLGQSVTADTWFINPRIGFLSTWSWGLTLGIDAGVQIPISASFDSTIPSNLPVNVPVASDATDMAHLLGKSVLPTVDLLRVGLLL